jgi:hypothetical protein
MGPEGVGKVALLHDFTIIGDVHETLKRNLAEGNQDRCLLNLLAVCYVGVDTGIEEWSTMTDYVVLVGHLGEEVLWGPA